jgi:membrane fusion protein (multidrug efflux system)
VADLRRSRRGADVRSAPARSLREPKAPPDEPPEKPETEPPQSSSDGKNAQRKPAKRLPRVLLLLGPLLLLGAGLWIYLAGGRYVSTDNAYVRADKLSVTADIPGTVAEVLVGENERVQRGQVLFRLDPEPYQIALAGAEAQLGVTRNEIATLQATFGQSLAQIEQAKTDVGFYETSYQRQLDLSRRGVGAQAALDEARRDLEAARDRLLVSERQTEAALAQLGGRPEGRIEDNPRFRQAQAQVEKARRDVSHTAVAAPMDGIVTKVDSLQVGEYLPAAQAAFSLVATDHVWIEANLKETDLTYLKVDDPADVKVDAYPGRDWRGSVASISPATGAEFSVLPAQNASGNWVKVVQRVPVRLRVDVPADAPSLRSGMSVEVSIDTGHERSFGDLVETARHWSGF